jgi:hypothetical protein
MDVGIESLPFEIITTITLHSNFPVVTVLMSGKQKKYHVAVASAILDLFSQET